MKDVSRRTARVGAAATPILAFPALADNACGTYDALAALQRLERVVTVLRTSYICEGWKLDEERANNAIRHFRTVAATDRYGHEGPSDECFEVFRFLADHGQSLDWVLLGDIGGLICKAASASRAAGAVQS